MAAEHPLQIIEWLDSHHDLGGWRALEDVAPLNLTTIRTVGFLIDEDKDVVRVAMSLGGFDEGATPQCDALMTIPKVCVLSRKALRG